jgi:hypothetical protein
METALLTKECEFSQALTFPTDDNLFIGIAHFIRI